MSKRGSRSLFYQVRWRNALIRDKNDVPVLCIKECSRHIPDKPLVAGGLNGFEMAEFMTRKLIVDDVVNWLPEGSRDIKHVLCCRKECGRVADAAVVWYPFEPNKWDGQSRPDVLEEMPPLEYEDGTPTDVNSNDLRVRERVAVGVPVMAWCGRNAKCKTVMLTYLLMEFKMLARSRQLLGGRLYCWQCGVMNDDVKPRKGCGAWCKECDKPLPNHRQITSKFGRILEKDKK